MKIFSHFGGAANPSLPIKIFPLISLRRGDGSTPLPNSFHQKIVKSRLQGKKRRWEFPAQNKMRTQGELSRWRTRGKLVKLMQIILVGRLELNITELKVKNGGLS